MFINAKYYVNTIILHVQYLFIHSILCDYWLKLLPPICTRNIHNIHCSFTVDSTKTTYSNWDQRHLKKHRSFSGNRHTSRELAYHPQRGNTVTTARAAVSWLVERCACHRVTYPRNTSLPLPQHWAKRSTLSSPYSWSSRNVKFSWAQVSLMK
jgi:hypothetical protein